MDKWETLRTVARQSEKRAAADHEVIERHHHIWAAELKGMAKAFAEVLAAMAAMDYLEVEEETLLAQKREDSREFSGMGIGEWDDLS